MIDNLVTISEETPTHLVSYWLGILVGMGISYTITPESPLFRPMQGNRERMREELRLARINPLETTANEQGIRIIWQSGNSDAIKVSARRV